MHFSTKPLDQSGAAAVICTDDRPQILGVEPAGQRRGAREIAEHHRELASLGAILHDRCGRRAGLSDHGGGGKLSDRLQYLQSVPESDAELFEMLIGQVGENGEINSVSRQSARRTRTCRVF
jgi:hypothetical protein